ncbi:DUF5325 family protein [Paenibacillus thermotolerans]|uniref:DUF5325 family protein n=1 Tax=Paenibacillus thermotolerans TaxID=3027807 RepID=UPI0023680D2E|nr:MULTISPECIES: DUF5325 family protein [unclassified Paenibacillus]
MNKPMSLLFAVAGIACLIAAGAALSYMKPLWALFFFVLSFAVTGFGMAVKRRLTKKGE